MKLVTLTTCSNNFEARIIHGRLAAEGISSFIQGENINMIYGGIAGMACRILVDEDDLKKAQEVMQEEGQ